MNRIFFVAFALVCSFLSIFPFPAIAAPHIIIFGDSLSDAGMNTSTSDQGNNTWALAEGKIGAPITSLDPQTLTHPLWINTLVSENFKGEKLYPIRIAQMRFLDPGTHSISYAFASAETGDHFLNDISGEKIPPLVDAACPAPGKISEHLACVPSVIKQVKMYLDAVHHVGPSDIFIIWAGGNDLFNNVKKLIGVFDHKKTEKFPDVLWQKINATLSSEKTSATDESLFPSFSHPVYNLLAAKDLLIARGATADQIYVIDLPDLAKTPAGVALSGGNSAILKVVHGITTAFNTSLRLALSHDPFNKHNLPAAHILSSHDLLNEIFANPEKYGMTHLSDNCVKDGMAPRCPGYVFFNDKHPTAPMGKVLGEWIAKSLSLPAATCSRHPDSQDEKKQPPGLLLQSKSDTGIR